VSPKPPNSELLVLGGGLAGCEAALAAASRGVSVALFEMRPVNTTSAHVTDALAELVCSNSLRSDDPHTAPGLLKREMEMLGSVVMEAARAASVPAGSALAVDRQRFAEAVQQRVLSSDRVRLVREEATDIPRDMPVIAATGPLTSDALADSLARITGQDHLHFFDAIAPIVSAESLDMTRGFFASRYGKGGDDYLNFPLDREQYQRLVAEILAAEKTELHGPDAEVRFFEGCMPVEEMARRGPDTLAYGPMKPVGLTDPKTGRRPFAVLQLRRENRFADQYNMVGFQTRMKRPEQARVFRQIPGMERAEFLRFGSVHRNTFVNAPRSLDDRLRLVALPLARLAGQVTGVEGYIESAATGILAGIFAAAEILGTQVPPVPPETAHGSLIRHLTESEPETFQPSNVHFGLLPSVEGVRGRRDRRAAASDRALSAMRQWADQVQKTLPVL